MDTFVSTLQSDSRNKRAKWEQFFKTYSNISSNSADNVELNFMENFKIEQEILTPRGLPKETVLAKLDEKTPQTPLRPDKRISISKPLTIPKEDKQIDEKVPEDKCRKKRKIDVTKLKHYIEKKLDSKLRQIQTKKAAAQILENGYKAYWEKEEEREIIRLFELVQPELVQFYCENMIPVVAYQKLKQVIEVENESKIRVYAHKRNKSKGSEREYWREKLWKEWKRMRQVISETYLCVYYETIFGA